jgi:uncharacterized protein DUF5658
MIMRDLKVCFIVLLLISTEVKAQDNYRALEITYAGLNAIDLGTTIYGLKNGAYERNPMLSNTSPFVMSGIKVVSVCGVLWLNRIVYMHNPRAAKIVLIAMNILYSGVVANNIGIIIKL